MSEYSPQEQAAYDFGFQLGKSFGAIGVEFNAINKKKWIAVYQHQIDELIKENEQLREELSLAKQMVMIEGERANEAERKLAVQSPVDALKSARKDNDELWTDVTTEWRAKLHHRIRTTIDSALAKMKETQ